MSLRFWLGACDVAERLHLPRCLWMWCVGRAAASIKWSGARDEDQS